ncbi:hypothetical protein D3C87_1349040 [compost metagenome]
MKRLEIFKEISIGGLTKEQLLQQLTSNGIQFNKYADILFEHPLFAPPDNVERVSLVKVKLSDFDLSNPCSYQEFTNRALAAGLKLCPLYLAGFLRLNFIDQPEGPYLTIASAKPENDENFPNGFYLRNHENSLWLRGYRADDFCEWPDDNEFIFLK